MDWPAYESDDDFIKSIFDINAGNATIASPEPLQNQDPPQNQAPTPVDDPNSWSNPFVDFNEDPLGFSANHNNITGDSSSADLTSDGNGAFLTGYPPIAPLEKHLELEKQPRYSPTADYSPPADDFPTSVRQGQQVQASPLVNEPQHDYLSKQQLEHPEQIDIAVEHPEQVDNEVEYQDHIKNEFEDQDHIDNAVEYPEQVDTEVENQDQLDDEQAISTPEQPLQSIEASHVNANATRTPMNNAQAATPKSTGSRIDEFKRAVMMARSPNISNEEKLHYLRQLHPRLIEYVVNKIKQSNKKRGIASSSMNQGDNLSFVPQTVYQPVNTNMNGQPGYGSSVGPSVPTSQSFDASSRGPIIQSSNIANSIPSSNTNNISLQFEYINNGQPVVYTPNGQPSYANNGQSSAYNNNHSPQPGYSKSSYSGRSDTDTDTFHSGNGSASQYGLSSSLRSTYSSAPTSVTSSSRVSNIPPQTGLSNSSVSGLIPESLAGHAKMSRSKRDKAPTSAANMNPPASVPARVQNMLPPTTDVYQHVDIFQLAPGTVPQENVDITMTEASYRPIKDDFTPPDPNAPTPQFAPYAARFLTSAAARTHRKRTRIEAKKQATDIERVIRFGRQYWVRRLYDSMIDISDIRDSEASIHRQRFEKGDVLNKSFDAEDLEATAHHVFDVAIAVHTRGWNRAKIYHKKAVRGKLFDECAKSLEERLNKICQCMKHIKATVDDAMRGGVTLALLCDNPGARSSTKESNNNGNKKRGERLALVKETLPRSSTKASSQTAQEVEGQNEHNEE